MSVITFKSKLKLIDKDTVVLVLPKSASDKLPSRGMTFVNGTINNINFSVALEPNGKGGHWFKIEFSILKKLKTKIGESVNLQIKPTKEWPEPKVPTDLNKELVKSTEAFHVWKDITPMARWDWIRWIGAGKQEVTRQRRIKTAISMLQKGKRRPCCFNRTECTLIDA